MSFLSYSLSYYKDKTENYEAHQLSNREIYEAKQLLRMLDDLVEEGYDELARLVEEQFAGITRLKRILAAYGQEPFASVDLPTKGERGNGVVRQLDECLAELIEKSAKFKEISQNPILKDITDFCKWIGYKEDTAYVFLLRDALLPYVYFTRFENSELRPWIIGRKFMEYLSPQGRVDDVVRASFFDALSNGLTDFASFKLFCTEKIHSELTSFPQVTETLKSLLGGISKNKIIVVESGCYGTFPMLLSAIDERVDFKMFTTVPFMNDVYRGRIFTEEYEENRQFETLYSQDYLFEFESFKDGKFFVSQTLNDKIITEALKETARIFKD